MRWVAVEKQWKDQTRECDGMWKTLSVTRVGGTLPGVCWLDGMVEFQRLPRDADILL